uniref:Translation initiation factor eIF2B subunit epsilon n=1 Tax=Phallusia mammillata TaxID=59560 RepID=A0A6F9DB51_9ASCI|nr:translation initiation factor eIF-2B subunit epsilon-like [Phallusia mammillata]
MSATQPRCLFPLANRPLLSYTLEFLASCEVKHVYVYCCHLAGQVKDYLSKSKWMKESSPCKVTPIVSADFTSLGDVMRDVDQKSLFESDFLVVPGDIVSNVQLKIPLEEHRIRREKDKNVPLMTLLMSKSSPKHRLRSQEDTVVIASDSITKRVLHYHKGCEQKKVMFPMSIFENPLHKVEIRYDLIDSGIWICAPQVPTLFTDNFDYQTQLDFVKGILINEEFLGNQIHMHVIDSQYCARVNNLHTFDVVSKNVVSRWTYPFVPDFCYDDLDSKSEGRYTLLRHNVYIHQDCSLEHDTVVRDNCIIGPKTRIGNRCQITNSVIGAGCKIADDCCIDNCYIWDNVEIGNCCTLNKSVICNNVHMLEKVTLEAHCALCEKVKIGPNCTLQRGTTIYLQMNNDEESIKKSFDVGEVGNEGQGYVWKTEDNDDINDLEQAFWGMSLQDYHNTVSESQIEEEESDADSDLLSDDEDDAENLELLTIDDDLTIFQREVKESLLGGFEEKIDCDNLILEINSSKYAYNMSVKDVVQTVMRASLEIADLRKTSDKDFFPCLKSILLYLTPLLCKYNKSSSSQLDYLYTLEEFASQHEQTANVMVKILMFLYENDVVCEEVILHWNSNPKGLAGDLFAQPIRKKV